MATTLAQLVVPAQLKQRVEPHTFARGARYAFDGRVTPLTRADNQFTAEVRGTQLYRIELRADDGELRGDCSCPVGMQGVFCKHLVAAALASTAAMVPRGAARQFDSTGEGESFDNDAQLDRFLEANGLEHVRRLGADALSAFVPERERETLRYVLGRQRFTDFATPQSLRRYGYALAHAPRLRELMPKAAHAFVKQELLDVERARNEARMRGGEGVDMGLVEIFRRIRSQHHPSVPPRVNEVLTAPNRLKFVESLPGFVWTDDRTWVSDRTWVPSVPKVELTFTSERVKAECSVCSELCIHSLAAVDAALMLLASGTEEAARVAEELRRPSWERALGAIDKAIVDGSRSAEEFLVSWRLHIAPPEGVDVQPFVHKPTKKGYSAGTRISASGLLHRHDDLLSPQDRRIAESAQFTVGWARRETLSLLVGHPRVFLSHNAQASVRVERATVGVLADHRGDSVVLVPALDGAPLPPKLLAQLSDRRAKDDAPVFLYEEGARTLTLLEVPPEVTRTLDAVARYGNHFPPESHAALVEKLSALSARVPVAMPRSFVGEEVPCETQLVLRLELRPDGRVRMEVRARPLPDSATFIPGIGPKDVHVRRNGKAAHATRELKTEEILARQLLQRLTLIGFEEEEEFTYLLPDPQGALSVLAQVQEWEEEKPQLEWVGEPVRIAARAGVGALKVALEKKRDWFGASGGLSVEGERVNLAVLLDAARRRERFVKTESKSFVEITEALQKHLEKLSDHAWQSGHGIELGPSAVELIDALAEDGAEVDADTTWMKLSERIFAARELTPKVPASLKAKLRDYQVEGFQWMTRLASWGAGAVLADDMGLGKTVQTLGVLLDRAKLGPALVVAPTSVGFNWVDEAKRFAPSLKVHVFAESEDRGGILEELGPKDVLVLSYGLLARDAGRLAKVRFATIVFDEAQSLKNATTIRARAARELQGDFKIALSGTPLENHLGELWSIFRIVFPGLLGSWDSFRDRYALPIEKKLDPTAAPALARVINPFLLRRTKGQVARELPSRTDLRVPVVLSPEEWQLYEDARLAALSELETPSSQLREQQRRVQVLAALTRLRMLASHPRLYDKNSKLASSKLERLLELVDELRQEGHRALVFSQFTSHLALVREVLDEREIPYLYLDGATPRKERQHLVKAFQEGDAPLFLISLKAGGFGLNLTGADNVIHLDPWWNPAVEDQASDRAHRIGQHRPVTVYRLVARGTIEEEILAMHEDKRELVAGVLEGKDEAARLTTKELLALLARPAARYAREAPPSETRHGDALCLRSAHRGAQRRRPSPMPASDQGGERRVQRTIVPCGH